MQISETKQQPDASLIMNEESELKQQKVSTFVAYKTVGKLIDQTTLKKQREGRMKFLMDQVTYKIVNKFDFNKVLDTLKKRDDKKAMDKLHYLCSSMSIDGEMTLNQFFTVLVEIGLDMPKRDAAAIFKNLDKDGSGRVT